MKKLTSFILALVMVFTLTSAYAQAITASQNYSDAVGGFKTSQKSTYVKNMFSDVDENQWYGANSRGVVKLAFELRIMSGKSINRFDPEGNLTRAEAIKMAAVVHNIYKGGTGVFVMGSPWYKVYVDYAITSGIINKDMFDNNFDEFATRAEMAGIFANCIPANELPEINSVVWLPDVTETARHSEDMVGALYGKSIFKLYRAGVLGGNDAKGTFRPYSEITRAEAAAIICRIILPSERLKLNLSQVIVSIEEFVTDELLKKYKSYEVFNDPEYKDWPDSALISVNMAVKNFKLTSVMIDYDGEDLKYVINEMHALDELKPDKPFLVYGPLSIGTMSTRGISFVDEKNVQRHFYLPHGGPDGPLSFYEISGRVVFT